MTIGTLGESALTPLIEDRWKRASRKLLDLAREIPDERFDWRPAAGVRSCAEVLRHVAFWNQYVAGTLQGRSVDDSINELPAVEYPTKSHVCEVLERTSNEVIEALRAGQQPEAKMAALVVPFIEHTSEHYGQLVVYARSMGIVPPGSRG